MLFEPNHTSYDLHFRIFRIPVRVHPMFWLMGVLLGWQYGRLYGMIYVLVWVACVFASILLHEIGHVVAGRWFGTDGHIVLFHFGGLAIGSRDVPKRWQRIVVSFAGPGAQFLLWGVLWFATPYLEPTIPAHLRKPVILTLYMLYVINLFWPILNLLPIWPLDGGMISREVCTGVSRDRGLVYSLGISGVVSGVLAVHCLMASQGKPLIPYLEGFGSFYMVIFFALFCAQSFMMLNEVNSRDRWDDNLPWER